MYHSFSVCDKCGKQSADSINIRIFVENGTVELTGVLFKYWRNNELKIDLCKACLEKIGFSFTNPVEQKTPYVQDYSPEAVELLEKLVNFIQSQQPPG